MIYCVLSDTHGNTKAIASMLADIEQRSLKIDAFIHAGDMAIDSNYLRLQTGLEVYAVYGNCDSYKHKQVYKPDEFIQVADSLIWITHGDRYLQYGAELSDLTEQAQVFDANIVIYGHTHRADIRRIDNILCINPGSLSLPRDGKSGYAILKIEGSDIDVNIYEI